MFPVMMDQREWEELNYHGIPKQLPMPFVKQFEDQLKKNHDQTVERLAERGGLHPTELCCAMYGMDIYKYFGKRTKIEDAQTKFAINMIVLRLREYNRGKEG
jgi:hypothetical protein